MCNKPDLGLKTWRELGSKEADEKVIVDCPKHTTIPFFDDLAERMVNLSNRKKEFLYCTFCEGDL